MVKAFVRGCKQKKNEKKNVKVIDLLVPSIILLETI